MIYMSNDVDGRLEKNMFGTMLYFNRDKVDEYNSLISKKKTLKVNGITVER